MNKLDGKVAIVTGASRGIGSGIARGLAKEGAQVVIANLRPEAGREAEKELLAAGLKAISIPTDVSDEAQVAALFKATVERFGRVDILVNNAGVTDGGPLERVPGREVGPRHGGESTRYVSLHPLRNAGHETSEKRTDHQYR